MVSVMVPLALFIMQRLAKFAEKNERSNHEVPVPTGIGIAFIIVAAGFMVIAHAPTPIIAGMLVLGAVGFMDDWRGLGVGLRLAAQAIAVAYGMTVVGVDVFQGLLPDWAGLTLVALLWVWMINLTNFMDGIDELTTLHVGTLCLGMIAVTLLNPAAAPAIAIDALIILICLIAFFPYNKHPACCFMGDAGSLPLGFVSAYLLFHMAEEGAWAAALILPAYYLTDATLTLIARLLQGEKIWQAHSKHFYQRAVRGGWSHSEVARWVACTNMLLIGLAIATLYVPTAPIILVIAAYVVAFLLCAMFTRRKTVQAYAA